MGSGIVGLTSITSVIYQLNRAASQSYRGLSYEQPWFSILSLLPSNLALIYVLQCLCVTVIPPTSSAGFTWTSRNLRPVHGKRRTKGGVLHQHLSGLEASEIGTSNRRLAALLKLCKVAITKAVNVKPCSARQ